MNKTEAEAYYNEIFNPVLTDSEQAFHNRICRIIDHRFNNSVAEITIATHRELNKDCYMYLAINFHGKVVNWRESFYSLRQRSASLKNYLEALVNKLIEKAKK